MQQYLQLMRHVLDTGTKKEDRTGTGTLSVFGYQSDSFFLSKNCKYYSGHSPNCLNNQQLREIDYDGYSGTRE